jgi:hypothetical protein
VFAHACPTDLLSDFRQPSVTLSHSSSISSLSTLISSYLHRASHVYSSIYTALSLPTSHQPRTLDIFAFTQSPATEYFLEELSSLSSYLESPRTSKFGAWDITGLSQIAIAHGTNSEAYHTASRALRAVLSAAMQDNIKLAVLTYDSPSVLSRRQPPQEPLPSPSPQEPIGSISTCFASAEACGNATNTCTGRGECVQASKAGRTCFVCACVSTISDKGKKESWAGEMCERKDISG